ncbi:MAG: hypothetical protein V3T70_00555 [Phycisphaerae bacterium]
MMPQAMTNGAGRVGDDGMVGTLPPTAERPEAVRRIPFVRALLFHWLMPRRYGPHLAAGSWKRALSAHLAAALIAAGIVGGSVFADELAQSFRGEVGLHNIRAAVAGWVLGAAAASTALPAPSWLSALAILGIVPLVELILAALGTATIPWAAGGDRAASVWRRSVNNVYWSTTIVIPGAVYFAITNWINKSRPAWFGPEPMATAGLLLGLGVIGALFVLWMRMICVGAHRYVGPPQGPAFRPHEPRCDDCGYSLFGLPLAARCPECGTPVRDSLPGGRRRPTVWSRDEFHSEGFADLLRVQWAVIRRGAFFRTLPVHSGLAAARHFWWVSFLLMAAVWLAAARFAMSADAATTDGGVSMLPDAGPAVIVAMLWLFSLHAAVMLPAALWAQHRHGIADYRVAAIVCYYASPLMWPLVLCVTLLMFTGIDSVQLLLDRLPVLRTGWLILGAFEITVALLLGLILLSLWFWARRLHEALAAVKDANV